MRNLSNSRSGRLTWGKSEGFTLIELLIVVAIISILAAIAIPNYLEAQVRAKVAKVKADHRTLVTAIEMYYIDHEDYMPYGEWYHPIFREGHSNPQYLEALTTPIAYVTDVRSMGDPFYDHEIMNRSEPSSHYGYYSDYPGPPNRNRHWNQIIAVLRYFGERSLDNYRYCFTSSGPNKILECDDEKWNMIPIRYDSSNGTISIGDILRFGP